MWARNPETHIINLIGFCDSKKFSSGVSKGNPQKYSNKEIKKKSTENFNEHTKQYYISVSLCIGKYPQV